MTTPSGAPSTTPPSRPTASGPCMACGSQTPQPPTPSRCCTSGISRPATRSRSRTRRSRPSRPIRGGSSIRSIRSRRGAAGVAVAGAVEMAAASAARRRTPHPRMFLRRIRRPGRCPTPRAGAVPHLFPVRRATTSSASSLPARSSPGRTSRVPCSRRPQLISFCVAGQRKARAETVAVPAVPAVEARQAERAQPQRPIPTPPAALTQFSTTSPAATASSSAASAKRRSIAAAISSPTPWTRPFATATASSL